MLSRWMKGVPLRTFRTTAISLARKDLESLKGVIGNLSRDVQRERRKPRRLIPSDSDHDDLSFPSKFGEQKIYENDDIFAGAVWNYDVDEKTGKTRMIRPTHNMSNVTISESDEEDEDDPNVFLANLTRKDFEEQGIDLDSAKVDDLEDESDIPALRSKFSDFSKPGFVRVRSSSDISHNFSKFTEALEDDSEESDGEFIIPIDRPPSSVGYTGKGKKQEKKVEDDIDDGELSDETRNVREFERIIFPEREPTFRKYPKEEKESGYNRFMGLVKKAKEERGISESDSEDEFKVRDLSEMNKYDIDIHDIYDLEPEEEDEEFVDREYDEDLSEEDGENEEYDEEEEKLKDLYYTAFYQKITDPKDFYNMLRYVFMQNPRSSSMLDYEYEDLDSETLIALNHLAQQFLDHDWEEHPFNVLLRLATAQPFKESWIDSGLIENEKEGEDGRNALYLTDDEEGDNRELENIYSKMIDAPDDDLRSAFERDRYLKSEIDLVGERADYADMTEFMDEIFEYEKERWLDGTTYRRMKEDLLDEPLLLRDDEIIQRHEECRSQMLYEDEESPIEVAEHANVPEHLSLIRNHGGLDFKKTVPFIVENSDKPVYVDEPWKRIESAMKKGGRKCPICAPNRKCVPLMPVDYTNIRLLSMFIDEDGTIKSKRVTGVCSKWQRRIARAIKTARMMNLIPYDGRWDFSSPDPLKILPSAIFRDDKDHKVNAEIAAMYRDLIVDPEFEFPDDGTTADFFAWRTEKFRKKRQEIEKKKAEMFSQYEHEISSSKE